MTKLWGVEGACKEKGLALSETHSSYESESIKVRSYTLFFERLTRLVEMAMEQRKRDAIEYFHACENPLG